MIIETKEIYKCEHCKKLYQLKRFAIQHELICIKNPVNWRPCYGCPMMEKKQTTVYYDSPMGGETERKVDLLYCNYKKQFFYTPKTEVKGTQFELGDEANDPMPIECDVDLNKETAGLNW
jgi:hypothetical protein